ncbi:MAG: Asp23/Gls24 family envelope stress response protein [Lachnospiraceae bacterium]|nr:Asp23/Gls24 family envelope stress response protein [Lachnospiraceae bacterium]
MNGTFVTGLGEVLVDNDVIAKCAGAAACECFGIVGMSSISVRDGLAKLLKMENLSNGVNVTIDNNQLYIDLHIIVSYGVNIPSVCENLIENVKYKVEDTTGLEVRNVNIYVEGVRVID